MLLAHLVNVMAKLEQTKDIHQAENVLDLEDYPEVFNYIMYMSTCMQSQNKLPTNFKPCLDQS